MAVQDDDPQETQEWLDALDAVIDVEGVERSHYLPVFARLGGYDKTLLDRLTLRPKAPYLEYWAHVAAFVVVL